jgi:hypothetical protein
MRLIELGPEKGGKTIAPVHAAGHRCSEIRKEREAPRLSEEVSHLATPLVEQTQRSE